MNILSAIACLLLPWDVSFRYSFFQWKNRNCEKKQLNEDLQNTLLIKAEKQLGNGKKQNEHRNNRTMNMEHLLAATNKVVELNNQLTAVTEQRDALAEALRDIVKSIDPYEMYKTAKRALER